MSVYSLLCFWQAVELHGLSIYCTEATIGNGTTQVSSHLRWHFRGSIVAVVELVSRGNDLWLGFTLQAPDVADYEHKHEHSHHMMLPLSGSALFARRRKSGQSVVEELSVQVDEARFQMNQVRGEEGEGAWGRKAGGHSSADERVACPSCP